MPATTPDVRRYLVAADPATLDTVCRWIAAQPHSRVVERDGPAPTDRLTADLPDQVAAVLAAAPGLLVEPDELLPPVQPDLPTPDSPAPDSPAESRMPTPARKP